MLDPGLWEINCPFVTYLDRTWESISAESSSVSGDDALKILIWSEQSKDRIDQDSFLSWDELLGSR